MIAARHILEKFGSVPALDGKKKAVIFDLDGTLCDLQEAFRRHHALQCGVCTPGILMSAVDFLARVPEPTETAVREMLSGHLCRCTGYTNIVAAILEVARDRRKVGGDV